MTRSFWNLLIYRVPAQPSTQRVYVWRKLKGWGGLYLQQSVCILPMRENWQSKLEKLKGEIVSGGGEADLLTFSIDNQQQNAMLVQRFQQQADEEYYEFLGRCQNLHQELNEERELGKLIFAELTENEAELSKLRSWLPKIRKRDWFEAPKSSQAVQSLHECELDFQLFSQQVYSAQGVHAPEQALPEKLTP